MSSYAIPYNSQSDWWNQPVDGINRLSITQHYRSDNINASEYSSLQQGQNGDAGFYTSGQVIDAYQSTPIMPNYWMSDVSQFTEPSMAFAMLPHQAMQGDFTTHCTPSASLPPAAFSKEPLPVDQFFSNNLAVCSSTSPNSFCPSKIQALPISDVPALEYDSTSDETAYGRRQWTDSPMPEEMESFVAPGDIDDSLENSDPCYAELLRQALMEKKDDHTMLLKDLYEWVRTHSSKAQDPSNKGWQNSVRHNLSMNAAFERVPPPNQEAGTKKTSYWRLTQHAVEHGISSTTRYRKDSKRKTQRNPNPAPIRVQAGAKGGQATRRSVRRQQLAASPLNGLSPSSDITRQRNLRRPHPLRQFPITQVDAASTQPRLPQDMHSSNTSSYFGNTADMFDISNAYALDDKIDDNRDLLAPYATAQPYFDWSVSPSPMGHAANDSGGWRMDQKILGL